MNNLVGTVALSVAALIHFEAIQMRQDEVPIKLALLLLAGIFFLRAEIAEIRERLDNGTGREQSTHNH